MGKIKLTRSMAEYIQSVLGGKIKKLKYGVRYYNDTMNNEELREAILKEITKREESEQ